MYLTSSDYVLMADGAVQPYIGLTFPNVAVPANAIITSSYIEFVVDELKNSQEEVVIQVYGEMGPSAMPADTTNDIRDRRRTTAQLT